MFTYAGSGDGPRRIAEYGIEAETGVRFMNLDRSRGKLLGYKGRQTDTDYDFIVYETDE